MSNVTVYIKDGYSSFRNWLSGRRQAFSLWINPEQRQVRPAAKYLGALLLLGLILGATYLFTRKDSTENTASEAAPEIAQIRDGSIGSALAPDVSPTPSTEPTKLAEAAPNPTVAGQQASSITNSGSVAGSNTGSSYQAPVSGVDANNVSPAQNFVAPKTGIDPKDPTKYWSDTFAFKAILPPSTKVEEFGDTVKFSAPISGQFLSVSVSIINSETLEQIMQQLKLSPEVASISSNLNDGSLSLLTKSGQSGKVIVKNNRAYYIFGDSKHFASIEI